MANAIPVGKQEAPAKAEAKKPEIIGKLPEGFEIPAKATRVVVGERGTVRVDY